MSQADSDGRGTLDRDGFARALRALAIDVSAAEIELLGPPRRRRQRASVGKISAKCCSLSAVSAPILQENMRFAAFFKIYQIIKLTFLKFGKIFQILR